MDRISRRNFVRSGVTLSAASVVGKSALARAAEAAASTSSPVVLIEAEGFTSPGGWVLDQEFYEQMGSAMLLAHGWGVPVQDAATEAEIPQAGTYRVWVRTRDWVAEWHAPGAPGRFNLLVNGKALKTVFGTEGEKWHWQDGGTAQLPQGKVTVALHDLTGFEGRCDAILFAADAKFIPPESGPELTAFRRKALNKPEPEDAGQFDFVVAGAGIAGMTAAITAARLGLKVALIHDRPVIGGNASSEIRVGMLGVINLPPYPALGNVVGEFEYPRHGDKPGTPFDADEKRLASVKAEKNISLYLSTTVIGVEKDGNKITAVLAHELDNSRELRFRAPLFADCTGDGNLGFLAGADYRYGRESHEETGELFAPPQADGLVMGASFLWYSEDAGKPVPFPETPWALQFNEESVQNVKHAEWDWEVGQHNNQVDDFERIRDYAFRAIYGNWSYQKNHFSQKEKYANLRLAWVPYVGGKRESRRLMGDVVLHQQDIGTLRIFPDSCVTCTWPIDLHVPSAKNAKDFPDEGFRTVAHFGKKAPYAIPYRCFYSRNIDNLFMAGRHISVTHVALGTTRVMRTTGMMGEVVGMAAAIATKHGVTPRGVYNDYLPELKASMTLGAGKTALAPPPKSSVPEGYKLAWAEEFDGPELDESKWDYRTDIAWWSTQLPQNVSVKDGNLTLSLTVETEGAEADYAGAGVISKQRFGYGYYESRFRILAGKGWHSSFWLMKHGKDNSPAELELDVVENDSIDIRSYGITTHKWKDSHEVVGHKRMDTLPLSDYHVYGCEYTPTTVKYFFDGELVHTDDISSKPQGELNVWLTSIAANLGNTDKVDHSRLPGRVDYDYVRFYQKGDGKKANNA